MKFLKIIFIFILSLGFSACASEEIPDNASTMQTNQEGFDLDLPTLKDYFLLTDVIQYESPYGAGYIDISEAPEGYIVIRDAEGSPKEFSLEGIGGNEAGFVTIYPEEGYETKEEVSFYLNRVAGPRSELYGPFLGDLKSLLE